MNPSAAREQPQLLDFYSDVARQLNTKVFLWGAFVQALVLELKDGNISLVKDLGEMTTDNRLLRSALVEALVRFGEGNRDQAKEFIVELIGQLTPPPKNFFVELARLLRPVQEDFQQAQPQKMIVVEAAMRLRLTTLLEKLALEPSPWLRNLATQNIFYLWKQDHEAGIQILNSLSQHVRSEHGLPDLAAVESTLALIGAILGFEHKDPTTLESLSTIGRRALRRVLYLNDLNKAPTFFTRISRAFLSVVYNLVIRVVLRFVINTLDDWGKHAWASRKAMEHYFTLSPDQKSLLKSMIPYLDYEEPSFETRVPDMITILDWGDQLSQEVVEFAVLGNGVKDFEKTLGVVRQLVGYGLSFQPPRFWIGGPMANLWQSAARVESPAPDFLRLPEEVVIGIQKQSKKWAEQASKDRSVPLSTDTRAAYIAVHLAVHYIYTRRAEVTELIQTYLEQAIESKDDEFLEAYILDLAGAFEFGYYRMTIAALKPLMNYNSKTIQRAIIDFLVRARNYDPDYIEDLLLRGEFPQELADRVLANPTSERLADLLTYQLITVVYDLFILGPKTLRNELKWFFFKGLELRSFQDFVSLIIREIFNLVLGEVVFSVPSDAPSRQILMKELK